MNIYSLLKKFNKIESPALRSIAIFIMHTTGRRYLGVFFDPVLGCNLRCKMCYFSDPVKRKELKGTITEDQEKKIANAFFSRALKLQIGCGAEPTLYKNVPRIIKRAKEKGVPYISITSNTLLLNEQSIKDYLEAGLDEITISVHGVKKETYEYFMTNADFDRFNETLTLLSDAKNSYNFKIRINYTINEDNLDELVDFFKVFGSIKIDILQLRPINNIGDSEYSNFSHSKITEKYDSILLKVKEEAISRGITCLIPNKKQAAIVGKGTNDHDAYCYISSQYFWKKDFNIEEDTFESYSKRNKLGRLLFKKIFQTRKSIHKNKLNYEID